MMGELKKIWHDEIVPKWRAETWRGRISWVASGICFIIVLPFFIVRELIREFW